MPTTEAQELVVSNGAISPLALYIKLYNAQASGTVKVVRFKNVGPTGPMKEWKRLMAELQSAEKLVSWPKKVLGGKIPQSFVFQLDVIFDEWVRGVTAGRESQ